MSSYNNMAGVAYDITRIVNKMIKRAQRDLDNREQKIIDHLIRVEKISKEHRLINISSLMGEKDRLAGKVVELVGSIGECVEKHVPSLHTDQSLRVGQPDEIPMTSIYILGKSISNHILLSASLAGVLAGLLKGEPLDDHETNFHSRALIKNACELEKDSVIRENWESLPDSKDPGGMIGHTYSQLVTYYEKIAPDFRDTFQSEADTYLDRANKILKEISSPSPDFDKCFHEASQLLFDASDLVGRASRWIPLECD